MVKEQIKQLEEPAVKKLKDISGIYMHMLHSVAIYTVYGCTIHLLINNSFV